MMGTFISSSSLQLLILISISSSSCCWAWISPLPLLPLLSIKGIHQQQHDDDCKKTSRLFASNDVSSSSSSSSSSVSENSNNNNNNNNPDVDNNNDSLTLKELCTRLQMVRQQVRNQYYTESESSSSSKEEEKEEAIEAQLEICDQLLCTRFRNLKLSRSIVQSSPIHGRGLFATRQIMKNELITCYPGDALLAWPKGKPGPIGCQLQAMYGPHITEEEQTSSSNDFFLLQPNSRDFEVVTGKFRSIVGDPSRSYDPAYLGHFCNDCASMIQQKKQSNNKNNKVVDEYNKKSSNGANAIHMLLERCHLVTVASRTIEKGEEIFVSYGEGYWKGRQEEGSSKEEKSSNNKNKNKKKKKATSSRGFGKTNKN